VSLTQKNVVVTGGSGFLGQYVVRALKSRGVRDIFVPRSKDFDLRKETEIVNMLNTYQPDIVIHLAAVVGGIGENQKNPGKFFYDNLVMGAHMIECSRLFGVEKFVGIGTVCSYPKYAPVPFKESDIWNGYPEETNAPYGLAKKMMLVQSQAYREQYGFNSIFLLPVNLYGPGDNFDLFSSHVIPAMIRKFVNAEEKGQKEVILWGDGSATREFIFAEDAAEGIVLAAEHYNGSDPVNIGSGQEIYIKTLAEIIQNLTEFRGTIIWDTSKPNGQPRRRLDVELARKLFAFEAKTEMLEGLRKTIKWYKDHKTEIESREEKDE
jgi:GDP-L-fucose synthase